MAGVKLPGLLDQAPVKLDLEARLHRARRSFEQLPIWMPGSAERLGDVASTLMLARGLKHHFPDKRVVIYCGKTEDLDKIRKMYPQFGGHGSSLDGVEIQSSSRDAVQDIMARNIVGLYSSVMIMDQPPFREMAIKAASNFYIEEYDSIELTKLPGGMKRNTLYQDRSRCRHIFLPTGFSEGSIGIHIDYSLKPRTAAPTLEEKKALLLESDMAWILEQVPRLETREWTMAYYPDDYQFRLDTSHESYLKALLKALGETGNPMRPIAIFDFGHSLMHDVKNYYSHEPFTDIYRDGEGAISVLEGDGRRYNIEKTGVYIIHVGQDQHSVFSGYMDISELPIAVTGDASLAEAICSRKRFIYHAPGWKRHVFHDFIKAAPDLLEDWRDASNIRTLFGCDPAKEHNVDTFPAIREFYLTHHDKILRSVELEREERHNNRYDLDAHVFFARQFKDQGVDCQYDMSRFFKEHDFALSMASYEHSKGLDAELEELKRIHIFGSDTGFCSQEMIHRLFFDPAYIQSFQKYEEAIIRNHDLCKNIAQLIIQAVQQYSD